MSNPILSASSDYLEFITEVKQRIKAAQIKAAISVNQELLHLYWYLAQRITEGQKQAHWGDGFLLQFSQDLKSEFPEMTGFSRRNLELMRQWYKFWVDQESIAKQLVSQIPWGHNLVIIGKIKHFEEALYYVQKTISNNWSRSVLLHHIESRLFQRVGKALNNFQATLPAPQSDLARQILKDPYNFDFLTLREEHDERELERALTQHITKFLLEMGAGFAYVGQQYKLEVAGDEFYIDLLFYHLKLRCYIVVELKKGKFKPEFAGQLNFYLNVVDQTLKHPNDEATIGLILCQDKNHFVAEYALKGIAKPIGISEYELTKNLPEEFKSSLPSIAEIEAELGLVEEEELTKEEN